MSAKSWSDIRVPLDTLSIEWVEREAARLGTTPSAFIRACIWHARRLGYTPPEATLTAREQRKLFDLDPTLNRPK